MKKIILSLSLCLIATFVQADHVMLKTLLEEKSAEFSKGTSEEIKQTFQKSLDDLAATGILEKAKNNGDIAPNFVLPDQNGKEVDLYKLLEEGPVVLIWYRGVWCPYCNITLRHYQEELGHFKKYGATLVAISSQLPDSTLSTAQKNELEFTVVSDVEGKVGEEYGVIFTLDETMAKMYKDYGIDLKAAQGNGRNELPLAATYIIDQDKKIRFAFLDVDYKKRAEPKYLINTLSQISDVYSDDHDHHDHEH